MSDDPKDEVAMTTNMNAISIANHDFSFSLYNELAKNETGNLFFSPFSIHVIMFMASVGAAAKTFDEILATIHLNSSTDLVDAYDKFLNDLTSEQDNLNLATGMFIDTKFNVEQSFVEICTKYLKSSLEKLNFKEKPEIQRQFINNWVLEKTKNKIENLFPADSITEETTLVLANAVHFKSSWLHEFDDTVDEPFFLTPSYQVNVKMMRLKSDLMYYHNDKFKYAALELPYQSRAFKMIILLPDEKDGLKNLEDNFSKINLRSILNEMKKFKVNVKLPRFKLEQTLQLDKTLSSLGCPTMFTRKANFSNIDKDNKLYVSKVVHKAYVDVDEKGTEAAGATGLYLTYMSGRITAPIPQVTFHANCPFVAAIVSHANDVMFLGRLTKP